MTAFGRWLVAATGDRGPVTAQAGPTGPTKGGAR